MTMYYSMDQKTFLELAENVRERLVQYTKDFDDYMIDRVPGMTKTTWREQLAFFRAQDETYWENLAMTHTDLAKTYLRLYISLTRREQREGAA
jgi:hypothetical protein